MTNFRRHERWMRHALRLAERGRFGVSPNPMVGACVVRAGRLIASGYHAQYGGPHAEITALKRAGRRARGATLYVTLEPCASWGKTPPCAAAILKSGIREVVLAVRDPNPRNSGKGIQALRHAGVHVVTGILEKESRELNAAFFKFIRTGLPYVTLKMAQSLDGKIATRTGSSRWISSPPARQFVHRLRAGHDAVLVGKNTLYLDNPFLSPRIQPAGLPAAKPWRVVLDPAGRVPASARIFRGPQITLLAVSEKKMRSGKLGRVSGNLQPVPEVKGRLKLRPLLRLLAQLGVARLLVEGGGETAWSFLEEKLVDRICWIVAPKLIGGRTARTSIEGDGVAQPAQAYGVKSWQVSLLGEDLLIEGDVN